MLRLRPKNVKAWRSLASVHLKISRQPIGQRSRARHKRLAAAAGRRAHLAPEAALVLLPRGSSTKDLKMGHDESPNEVIVGQLLNCST